MKAAKFRTGAVVAGLVLGIMAGSHALTAGPPSGDVYGYTDFYGVPRLGDETVSGTGCGGDGSVSATIPDGLWRGYARSFDGPTPGESTRVEFDLVCVYRGNVNPDLVAKWQAEHPGKIEPWVLDGFMINNNARTRTVGLADSFFAHGTQWTDTGCPFAQPDVPFNSANDVWISIAGGQAQWMVSSCSGPVEGTVPPTTQTMPPPPPSGGLAFPYASVYEVPQLGHEPVRGTGCGGDGSIGETIPDGLWWGAVAGQSPASLEFDLACIYSGPVGEQMGEQFIAANPDYGSPPYWPGVGFFVNNNLRTRTVPLAAGFVRTNATGSVAADGTARCVPPADPSAPPDYEAPRGWLNIVDGQAIWFLGECPHD